MRRLNETRIMGLSALILATILSGCSGKTAPKNGVMMANPASVYCKEQGGRLEIRHEKDGETGYCHLAYGRVVEEWVLFHAAHRQARNP